MMIGIVGAHRTGKTTLAQALSKEYGIPFHKTDVKGIMEEIGIDPAADLPFPERYKVQVCILDGLLASYQEGMSIYEGQPFLVDRTPFDALGYLRTEILRTTVTPEVHADLDRYEEICFTTANHIFQGLIFVQPGIPLVAEPGKAPANRHYQAHVSALMYDSVTDPRNRTSTLILPLQPHDIQSRVTSCNRFLNFIIESRDNTRRETRLTYH